MEGRVGVVTGAGSGIGREFCLLLAENGARGIICFDISESAVVETVHLIQQAHPHCHAVPIRGDVGNELDVKSAVQKCVDLYGGINFMFANAGIAGPILVDLVDEQVEMWEQIFRVNVIGVFNCIKFAAIAMKNNPIQSNANDLGSIVCVASVAGLRASAGNAAYSASKAAVINMVQTAAIKLGFQGVGKHIRVNAICPGLVETGMTSSVFEIARARGKESKIGHINPTQRAGTAREVAEAALFLASDRASMITGQALPVDCGLSASLPVSRPSSKL